MKEAMAGQRFRHMKPWEKEQARLFVEGGPLKGQWAFGVPLESDASRKVAERDPSADFWTRYSWMLKIDGVCTAADKVWIVEFEMRARYSSLAQLLLYRGMYMEQYAPTKPVDMILVYARPSPDLLRLLDEQGIKSFHQPVKGLV